MLKFVYADLNGLNDNFLEWKTLLEWKRLLRAYPNIQAGDIIPLWTDDGDENGKYDPMVYEGIFCAKDNLPVWGFQIQDEKIEHLSISTRFHGYTLKDVMGEEDYLHAKKNNPELF